MGKHRWPEKLWTKNYPAFFLLLWTLLVGASVIWNFYRNHQETIERARVEAQTIFQHNLAYRRWNTANGGVYAEISKENEPNPYIHSSRRDIITTDGVRLTLINPYRMTRQAYELLSKQSPLASINRTISLKPLNPANTPDEWEAKALRAFEEGKNEFSEITKINGQSYMRVLKPYITEKGCLKCHGQQGYKIGDIRGAMSIAVPMQPYISGSIATAKITAATHILLWLIGAGAIVFLSRGLQRYQKELLQARRMESLGRMAGGIAHDFNNVLTAITGFAHLLKDLPGSKSDELTECTKQICLAVKFGKNLTSNLLEFGRKQISNPVRMELREVINEVSDIINILISDDIVVKISHAKNEVTIFADRFQVGQIIVNLCMNAKDAMPRGGELSIKTELRSIRTGTDEGPVPGTYMVLTVADTGTGIDEKDLPQIFEPFFSTKLSGKGTGLGLAIVKSIVDHHNGFIEVHSKTGQGTAVKIFFPAAPSLEESEPAARGQTTRSLQTGTLLVAEDDELAREFLEKVLTKNGYNVILAEDGDAAITKYRKHSGSIDMLILDLVLPVKNGREVHSHIRSDNPKIETLFISGYTDDILTGKGIIDENVHFLSKPLDPLELLAIIRAALDSRHEIKNDFQRCAGKCSRQLIEDLSSQN